jgi:two-component system chemotaxis response regulator CheB
MAQRRDIVVIGSSAGGMEALKDLVRGLPADLAASLFVVWHMSPGIGRSVLPDVLTRSGPLPASAALDGERIERGRIYVAPPDHHLLLEEGTLRVTKGPKENRFRPAVDPLFRSAAYVYGPRVIGVVLSGALDDGTAGLWTIKLRGGVAIVQDPQEALHSSMPLSARRNVQVDHVAPVARIAELISLMSREEIPAAPEVTMEERSKTESEIRVAEESSTAALGLFANSELSPFTCPECHGVLAKLREGSITRFRCHTGHAFSSAALLASISEQVEVRLWDALRAIEERMMLLVHLGEHLQQGGDQLGAERYFREAKQAEARAQSIREAVLRNNSSAASTEELALGGPAAG